MPYEVPPVEYTGIVRSDIIVEDNSVDSVVSTFIFGLLVRGITGGIAVSVQRCIVSYESRTPGESPKVHQS